VSEVCAGKEGAAKKGRRLASPLDSYGRGEETKKKKEAMEFDRRKNGQKDRPGARKEAIIKKMADLPLLEERCRKKGSPAKRERRKHHLSKKRLRNLREERTSTGRLDLRGEKKQQPSSAEKILVYPALRKKGRIGCRGGRRRRLYPTPFSGKERKCGARDGKRKERNLVKRGGS